MTNFLLMLSCNEYFKIVAEAFSEATLIIIYIIINKIYLSKPTRLHVNL